MTNTIPNVPRELLEELRDAANESMNATTRQHQIDHFAGLIAKADAMLSAPSTTGVDGLEVVAWQQRYIDPDEGVSVWGHADARSASILKGRSDYELRPLYAVPQDAQAIIDGLRGEVERITGLWELELARAQKAENELTHTVLAADQQARRIGELEGLLIDIAGMFHGPGIEGGPLTKLLRRIDAALSAGKEGE